MDRARSSMGAKTLPGPFFLSRDVYAQETRRIFQRHWICVGRSSEIPQSGNYLTQELDGERFILVRDDQNRVRCFYDVCRHRGARISEGSCGHYKKNIQCPYHAWTYNLRGDLIHAPNMNDVTEFDVKQYPLHAVRCAEWQGFLFINLDPDGDSLESCHSSFAARFDAWELKDLLVAHQIEYDVQANWKVVFHNYSECYHCAHVHPQLNPLISVKTASNDFEEGPFLGGPMTLAAGNDSISSDGARCGEPFPQLSDQDLKRVYFYTLFPSLFISPHPDYVLTHRLERQGCNATRIVCQWLFPQHTINRSDFDPSRAIEFWDQTNRQDWHVCESTQQGVGSAAYQPGPYSNLESVLAAFDRYYLEVMGEGEGGVFQT